MVKHLAVWLLLILGGLGIVFGVEAQSDVRWSLLLLWIVAVLWMTEYIHVTATALLVPIFASLFGLLPVKDALTNFAHPVIFIFLGGYGLAAAMHAQKLDLYIAHRILQLTRGSLQLAVVSLCFATSLLSMWISNMATTALMLPLIIGLLSQDESLSAKTKMFALLGIAYSANLGGIATLVGSAPNGIAAAALGMDFVDWLAIGGSTFVLLWPIMITLLWYLLRPKFAGVKVDVAHFEFNWSKPRLLMVGIFSFTVIGWVFSKQLGPLLGITERFDTWVALVTLVLLVFAQVASWSQIQKQTDWGILLLFGGGLTLGALLKTSGASVFLGTALSQFVTDMPTILVVFVLVCFVVFLTELTSNTATTALLVPIFITLPTDLVSNYQAALAVGISASCAFMLPVATPPNAIVHGTGLIDSNVMKRVGLVLNLLCILVIGLLLTMFF